MSTSLPNGAPAQPQQGQVQPHQQVTQPPQPTTTTAAPTTTTTPAVDPKLDPLNMLSANFSAALALASPQSVKIPIKSAKVYQSLSETAHLLPFFDSNFKGEKQYLAGSSKHRLSVELANKEGELRTSLKSSTESNQNPNNNKRANPGSLPKGATHTQLSQKSQKRIEEQLQMLLDIKNKLSSQVEARKATSVLARFTTLVKVSKTPDHSHPLLLLKGSSNAWYNRLRKNQLTRLFCLMANQLQRQLHLPHNNQQAYHQPQQYHNNNKNNNSSVNPNNSKNAQPHQNRSPFSKSALPHHPHCYPITQQLIGIFGATATGHAWIRYYLCTPPHLFSSDLVRSPVATSSAESSSPASPPPGPPPSPPLQHMQLHDPSRPPITFQGHPIRYPYLTPRHLLYMLLSTHSFHKCKVHETRRKRMNYPCICVHRAVSPPHQQHHQQQQQQQLQSQQQQQLQHHQPSHPQQSNTVASSLATLDTTLSNITESKVKQLVKKTAFVKAFHTPGPLSLLSSLLYSETQKCVRITTIGDVPALPYPLCTDNNVWTQNQRNWAQMWAHQGQPCQLAVSTTSTPSTTTQSLPPPTFPLNLASAEAIQQYSTAIPLVQATTILPLLQSLDELSHHEHWWGGPQTPESRFIFNLFYNRSGNPHFVPQFPPPPQDPASDSSSNPNPTAIYNDGATDASPSASQSPPVTFQKGRLSRGVAGVLYGKLAFFDRTGNVGLDDAVEYKWVWLATPHKTPLPALSTSPTTTSEMSSNDHGNDQLDPSLCHPTPRLKTVQHGVWTVMTRKLPRIILTGPTIVTVAQDNRKPSP